MAKTNALIIFFIFLFTPLLIYEISLIVCRVNSVATGVIGCQHGFFLWENETILLHDWQYVKVEDNVYRIVEVDKSEEK